MKQNYTLRFLSLLLSLFLFINAQAQLNYLASGVSTTVNTYTDLGTNGTVITTPNTDDAFSSAQNIGFTFTFNGVSYTQFVLSTNGFIKLGSDSASSQLLFTSYTQPPTGGPFNSTAGVDSSLIIPFGNDLWNRGGAQTPEYRVYTSGIFGSRICTIQWKNVADKLANTVLAQYDTLNFQVKLYESTNVIEFVYGRWVVSANASNARFAACGLKGSNTTTAQLLTITKASSTAWSVITVNSGNYTTNALNYGNNVGVARPAPDIGRTYRFGPVVFNDAAVNIVYSTGKVVKNVYQMDSIRATVSNPGVNSQSSLTVTCISTGANTSFSSVTIPTLAPNASVNVAFPPLNPQNFGTGLITVSVPTDDNNANNAQTYGLSVSDRNLAYTDSTQPAAQSYGGTTGLIWACKYRVTGTRMVTSIKSFIVANSNAVGDTVCGVVTDTLGNILARSANYIVQNSDLGAFITFTLTNPAVITNKAFLAGVGCGNAVNSTYFMGTIQSETPTRADAFWQINNGIGISTATVGMNYGTPLSFATGRLMMECTVDPLPPNDIGVSASIPSANGIVPVGSPVNLRAIVKNFGTATQTSGQQVRYSINGGAAVGPLNTNISLAQNDTTGVLFSGTNAMTFPSAGNYTVKIYTSLASDGLRGNDTLLINLTAVAAISTFPYRIKDSILSVWSSANSNGLFSQVTAPLPNGTSSNNVLKINNATIFGNDAKVISAPFNFTGITSPVLHFYVACRPSSTANSDDSLQVLVSNNGGTTFTPVFTRSSQLSAPILGTVAASTVAYTPSSAADWRHETVDLSPFGNTNNILVAFRAKSALGNNIYISDITVSKASLISSIPISVTGTYTAGNMSVNFNSAVGATGGSLSIVKHAAGSTSLSSPVFATNTTATTNNSNIFTPTNVSIDTYWSITYSGIGSNNAASTVPYSLNMITTGMAGIPAPDYLYFLKRADAWDSWKAVSTSRAGNILFTTSTLTGFSEFTVGSQPTFNALPVTWKSFTAYPQQQSTMLNWVVASETNNDHYEIERSVDQIDFIKIGSIKGAGTSNQTLSYKFVDNQAAVAGKLLYYRIKQVDLDGNSSFSAIVKVQFDPSNDWTVTVFPNPATDVLTVNVTDLNLKGSLHFSIFDIQGKLVLNQESISNNGAYTVADFAALPKGIYLVKVDGGQGVKTIRVQKN